MRYVAAYLLAVLGGKNAPTAKDIEKILGSVGIESETDKITKIINELKGKNVEEVITAGQEKLASVPAGGAVAAASSGAVAAPAGGDAAPAAKKEEKKEESEESDDDMGFGLFD